MQLERAAKFIKNFERKKRDLPLVILFEIEVAVAANTPTSHAFDHRHFDRRVIARLASVMADKIVAGRNVKMADFHRTHDNIEKFVSHERKRDRFAKNYPSKTRRRTGISTRRSHNRVT